jgi:hypothetical protein
MKETIRKLLNSLNIGTNQEKVGDYIAALEDRIKVRGGLIGVMPQ